jgi:hypothetical protein
MGKIICKFEDGDKTYYLEWSTIADGPATFGMSLEEFTDYYKEEYGRRGLEFEFPERMARVEKIGTSSRICSSVDEVISGNRAGKGETMLTKEQIIEAFCRNNDEDKIPYGKVFNFDTEEYEDRNVGG